MKPNPVNLCAGDVPARTLETHFGYRTLEIGTVPDSPWATNSGSTYAILVGEDVSDIVNHRTHSDILDGAL